MEIIERYFKDFSEKQREQFAALEALYTEWNAKINVISRKDIGGLYEKHVLHSLAIAAIFQFPDGTRIVDIGTGGGFPGIPLAIFFPAVQFHLVDAIGKKIKVVNEVAAGIGLKNITTSHGRVEDIHNQRFHFAVSRAVAPLATLWKWAKPVLKPERFYPDYKNGLICLKGGDLAEEIHESRLRPHSWDIHTIFSEDYFLGKYLLYVPA